MDTKSISKVITKNEVLKAIEEIIARLARASKNAQDLSVMLESKEQPGDR